MKIFYCIVLVIIEVRSEERFQGWNYINLHCRDNENTPVDWWYVYKPPLGAVPNSELGRIFSYITPHTAGRWVPSARIANSDSMIQNTLSPLYRPTYLDYLAVVAYTDKEHDVVSKGSSASGLMMADEIGGVWMGFSVPNLLNLNGDRPSFPAEELEKGHLFMCLSLDLPTLNLVAVSIREMAPKVLRMRVPQRVRHYLPDWQHFSRPVAFEGKTNPIRPLDFVTAESTIRFIMMVRRPGEKHCLYKSFARAKGITLDVYGHGTRTKPICEKTYGVRNIDSISLKYKNNVYYIDNRTDNSNFAVSTAAHWQRKGQGAMQYWTCTSSMEREDTEDKGGVIVCVEDYDIWWSFDNMKIREPNC